MVLTIYGSVSKKFKILAQLTKLLATIKSGAIIQTRLDCYNITNNLIFETINKKFIECNLQSFKQIEVFLPSQKYPSHIDEGGLSYFIPLESGNFLIDGVNYPVIPFVLYSFNDGELHNSDFGSIMLK